MEEKDYLDDSFVEENNPSIEEDVFSVAELEEENADLSEEVSELSAEVELELDEDEEELENLFEHEDIDDYSEAVNISGEDVVMSDTVYDAKGNPVETQVDGDMSVEMLPMDDVLVPPRGKMFVSDVSDLEESIHLWGLVEPIHVVPHKGKYFLLHGYRRLLAYRNMGFKTIPAVVNSTRPKEIIRYLEVISNNIQSYNFIEMMDIGKFIEERQHSFSHDTIENILGLPTGEYLKAKYIDAAKASFDDIYSKVVKKRMSIDQAFKKIEREIQKAEDEANNPLDELNKNGLPDDYGYVEEEDYVQQTGERHILDPALRKYIEGRDQHSCQACGMGLGEPDLASVFQVHHLIPVKHKGPDKKTNLILLCPNCHSLAHAYDEGRFKPSQEMVDSYYTVYNAVVLGNIVRSGLPTDYPGDAWGFYMERAKQEWLEEDYDDSYEEELLD